MLYNIYLGHRYLTQFAVSKCYTLEKIDDMRLLCLSDLHLRSEAVVAAIDRQRLSPFPAQIAATVAEVSPDAVVVTGDTVSPAQVRLLSATLRTFIPADLPVVATLGNHEFWGRTFEDTLAKLKKQSISPVTPIPEVRRAKFLVVFFCL